MVHLVYVDPKSGQKGWFVRTDRRQNPTTKVWETWPLVDDDPRQSSAVPYEYASIARHDWREKLKLNFRIALEPLSDFIDDENTPSSSVAWEFRNYYITCRETGEPFDSLDAPCVLLVRAVNTPEGKQFCLRADEPSLAMPSVFVPFSEGPEAVVEKAWSLGFRYVPIVNPSIEQRRREAEHQAQRAASARFANIRPGDR